MKMTDFINSYVLETGEILTIEIMGDYEYTYSKEQLYYNADEIARFFEGMLIVSLKNLGKNKYFVKLTEQ